MRMSETKSCPVLSEKSKEILNKIASGRMYPACIVQRAKIVLLSHEGKLNKEIKPLVSLCLKNIGKWRMRFINAAELLSVTESEEPENLESKILEVLHDIRRRGASPKNSADQKDCIITVACQPPADHGFELSHWNLSALRLAVINEGIVEDISVSSLSRILNSNKVQPHKNRYWLHSKEKYESPETYKTKIKAVNEAYATAKEISGSDEESNLRIISTDEMTGIQALEHKFPDKLPIPGKTSLQEFEYIRHGTTSLTAFFDVVTGKIPTPYINNTRNEEDFVCAISNLIKTDPDKKWIIIADNLNTHYSASLVEYIAKEINYTGDLGKKRKQGILKDKASRISFLTDPKHKIRFLYTPIHCSWMNQIEIWFGIINRQLLKRKSYTSVEDLINSIYKYIDQYNSIFAHPFEWKYKTTPIGD